MLQHDYRCTGNKTYGDNAMLSRSGHRILRIPDSAGGQAQGARDVGLDPPVPPVIWGGSAWALHWPIHYIVATLLPPHQYQGLSLSTL